MWATQQSNPSDRRRAGFTIVELLIVIVIIGILAAITIIAYNGIQQRAIGASLKTDLNGASNQLKMYQVDNSAYPTSNDCSGGVAPLPPKICLKSSNGNSYSSYMANNSALPQTFSLQAVQGTVSYVVTDSTAPTLVVAVPPTLTSPTATNIGSYTATLGATITSDGGSAITAEGTCWGATVNPTTNCTPTGGTTTGIFTQAVAGITAGASLYYRGYATNAAGTAYSPDGTFTTLACFLAGTMISTPNGDVAIEKLRAGDRVWSWTSHGLIDNVIRQTFVHHIFGYYKLTTMSGSLLVTGIHPLLTTSGYKIVDSIQLGDGLVTKSGNKTVISKTYIGKAATVYNLEVDQPHNYFANGFVAHNKPM